MIDIVIPAQAGIPLIEALRCNPDQTEPCAFGKSGIPAIAGMTGSAALYSVIPAQAGIPLLS
ncbi:MAG: hypothetical protein ACJ8ER_17235 [Allosphingosinicella sp.]